MKRTPLKRTAWKRKPRIWAKKPPRRAIKAPKGTKRLESVKSLKKRAWTLISLYVRKRDGYRCVTCGATEVGMDCGHYRHNTERSSSLGGNALWYDLRNLNCQCGFRCNKMLSGNLDQYALFLTRKYGPQILEEIQTLYRTPKHWTREEILDLIKDLNQKLQST
jgi:hypothetical protein